MTTTTLRDDENTLADPHSRPRSAARNVAVWVGSALALAIVIAAAVFYAGGGRWFIVETPSMGQTAPVGTLVLDEPVAQSALRVGDVISFHPPTAPSEVYTHRIVSFTADGLAVTRGDINGATDPWQLGQRDIIGKAAVILPVFGWIVRAAPILMAGMLVLWLATRLIRSPTLRGAVRLLGSCLLVSVTAFILRPLIGVVLLTATASTHGAQATIVSTGVLPTRLSANDGVSAHITSGQVVHMHIPALAHGAHYQIASNLDLSPLGWVIFFVVCALPLIGSLVVGLPASRTVADA